MRKLESKIETRLVLRAYQKVLEHGMRTDNGYELDGLLAIGDFDGYGVSLSDGVVTVRALFHNQLAIDSPGGKALEAFVKRVRRVAEADHAD